MNKLDIAVETDHFPSLDLLVDGRSMADWLSDGNAGIPLWLVTDGLPAWPLFDGNSDEPDMRIVTVCGCGEPGCGHSRCTVSSVGDTVVFYDFRGDVLADHRELRFVFSLAEYETVLRKINDAKAVYAFAELD